jgi:hypothetical protein
MNRDPRLSPRATTLYAVRWVRRDGREIRHRYFTREADARAYESKLVRRGRPAQTFRAPVGGWEPVSMSGLPQGQSDPRRSE